MKYMFRETNTLSNDYENLQQELTLKNSTRFIRTCGE